MEDTQDLFTTRKRYGLVIWPAFLICWVMFIWRLMTPRTEMQARGGWIWIEIVLLLFLGGYILLCAWGLGHLFLRIFRLPLLSGAESSSLALLIGLGIFSMAIMISGLIGWLNIPVILIWLAISGSVALRELPEIIQDHITWIEIHGFSNTQSRFEVFLQTVIFISIPLQLISVASPVWDYDALLYHLEVPRQFLAAGRIYFNPEVWRTAQPYLGEMPFIVGIAFHLDSLAKLINLTYAVLFVYSVYLFSLRFLGRQVAYTVTAILVGAPAFLLWSTWASVDYAWAAYEFWSIYAISLWLANDRTASKWLILAGIMSGLAVSVKYRSIPTLLIVSILVAWKSAESVERPVKNLVVNLLIFGASVGLVMGAWYIKNWIWTGNPVYPLVFGGLGWNAVENQALNDYMQSFGVGKTWLDYLLLPFNVYAHHDRFATIPIEIIHPALWLSFFFPFAGKSKRTLNIVVAYSFLYFILWAVNSQLVRFLLPWSGVAAILAGSVIENSPSALKNLLKFGLLGGLMVLSLIHQIVTIQSTDVWSYLSGQKSAAQFLEKVDDNFDTVLYIQSSLTVHEQVLFLWDGRGYYCDQRCIPDDEQSTAIRLAVGSPVPQELARELNKTGITHLMLSTADAGWFMGHHDLHGLHRKAFDYFTEIFLPACGKKVFQDKGMMLFELTCH